MLNKIYETKNIPTKVLVGVERSCDICKKKITSHHYHIYSEHRNLIGPIEINTIDVCSAKCMNEWFTDYIKYSNNKLNTGTVRIEHVIQDFELKAELRNIKEE